LLPKVIGELRGDVFLRKLGCQGQPRDDLVAPFNSHVSQLLQDEELNGEGFLSPDVLSMDDVRDFRELLQDGSHGELVILSERPDRTVGGDGFEIVFGPAVIATVLAGVLSTSGVTPFNPEEIVGEVPVTRAANVVGRYSISGHTLHYIVLRRIEP
jgi:hypothetical protein